MHVFYLYFRLFFSRNCFFNWINVLNSLNSVVILEFVFTKIVLYLQCIYYLCPVVVDSRMLVSMCLPSPTRSTWRIPWPAPKSTSRGWLSGTDCATQKRWGISLSVFCVFISTYLSLCLSCPSDGLLMVPHVKDNNCFPGFWIRVGSWEPPEKLPNFKTYHLPKSCRPYTAGILPKTVNQYLCFSFPSVFKSVCLHLFQSLSLPPSPLPRFISFPLPLYSSLSPSFHLSPSIFICLSLLYISFSHSLSVSFSLSDCLFLSLCHSLNLSLSVFFSMSCSFVVFFSLSVLQCKMQWNFTINRLVIKIHKFQIITNFSNFPHSFIPLVKSFKCYTWLNIKIKIQTHCIFS